MLTLVLLAIPACGAAPVADRDGGATADADDVRDMGAVETDAASIDSGAPDSEAIDSGASDSGTTDAGAPDAGPTDSGAAAVAEVELTSELYMAGTLGAADIQVFVDGTSVGGAGCVGFGRSFPGFFEVAPGAHAFRIENCFDHSLLHSSSITIPAGHRSMFFYGDEASGPLGLFEIPTSRPTTPSAGSAIVRIVNVAPTAGAVDFYVVAMGGSLTGATPASTSIAVGAASAYVEVPEGARRFVATRSGTSTIVGDTSATVDGTRPATWLLSGSCGGRACASRLRDVQTCVFEGGTEVCYF
jgi:hypothetical protein